MQKSSTPFPFETFLAAAGAEFDYQMDKYGQGMARTTNYRFRYYADEVEIAVNANFDRWANSVNVVCRPVPANQETFDALLGALDRAVREKRFDPDGWESYDIWPLVRKVRREQQSAARLARRQGRSLQPAERAKTRLQRLALKVRKAVTRELQLAREHPAVKAAFLRTWQDRGLFACATSSADDAWKAVQAL
jgi:hypothetical protein